MTSPRIESIAGVVIEDILGGDDVLLRKTVDGVSIENVNDPDQPISIVDLADLRRALEMLDDGR